MLAEGKREEKGFPMPYSVSKIAVIALARIQNRDLQKDKARPDMIVNSVCVAHRLHEFNPQLFFVCHLCCFEVKRHAYVCFPALWRAHF